MTHYELWVTDNETVPETIRSRHMLTEEQEDQFWLLASGVCTLKRALEQAKEFLASGKYTAARVYAGKRRGKLVFERAIKKGAHVHVQEVQD